MIIIIIIIYYISDVFLIPWECDKAFIDTEQIYNNAWGLKHHKMFHPI